MRIIIQVLMANVTSYSNVLDVRNARNGRNNIPRIEILTTAALGTPQRSAETVAKSVGSEPA
jgi:hypothetical protein